MSTRREFLGGAITFAAIATSYQRAVAQGTLPPKSPCGIATTAMGAHLRGLEGVKAGLRDNPVAYLDYCRSLGAGGVQHAVSTMLPEFRKRLDELEMYYEGEARPPATLDGDFAEFEAQIKIAKDLGASVVRTVSRPLPNSSGRRYDSFTSVQQFDEWLERSNAIIMKCLPIAEKYKIAIALENHKDRKVEQHVAFLKKASSEYLGSLIDPGNNMAFMEEAAYTVAQLAPYVKATSLKDMGVAPYEQGFLLAEVPFGTGINDQVKLFQMMRKHNPKVNPTTELITRDPLKVAVLTDDYYRSFPEKKAVRDKWMAMVRAKQTRLPILSTQSRAAQFQAEEDNNRQVFQWGVTHLRNV
ncbi:sugar phosphate isomerase/epimerase family protein [Sphingomonas quercus]|uniref:Sugar phosphate isomerase/epimerase n=1 Tax=Sphingomonas quercus TaxID=2842451 RepID=A0ABS6BLE7_9SPHN|nr:TIM barrel protein [Sphingomonas quercus]MBU3079142.1 sugar phosphate isomerase/epimerase [Sphingomonas quercus]